MSGRGVTWAEKLAAERAYLGREPTLAEALDLARDHQMTPEEVEAQRASWVRAFSTPCEHGRLDFEQCPGCRALREGDA